MFLATVTGTLTTAAQDPKLTGKVLLLADHTDAGGRVLNPGLVVCDVCGAGVGDRVIVATGSAARTPPAMAGVPADATVIAIVDRIAQP